MATLQTSTMFSMKGTSQIHGNLRRSSTRATINMPKFPTSKNPTSLPKLPSRSFAEINLDNMTSHVEQILDHSNYSNTPTNSNSFTRHAIISPNLPKEKAILAKMYTIMEAVSDRVEMHKNIGAQRDNWNSLLLTSINSITLTAATMSGIAAATALPESPAEALKLGAIALYLSATGLLAVMNKIQPSQLAEEQRNASRLFKQLLREIQTKLSLGNVTSSDVNEAMERVLALDKAYPLPLLGSMLEKFPKKVEPAVWWPRKIQQRTRRARGNNNNGWSEKLEEEMREILGVIERKDVEDYLRLSKKALDLNKVLAMSGPVLTGLAAFGTALSHLGTVPAVLGVVGGALAAVVNSFEHGGQVGMVFEMYRSNAGFFRLVEEKIESNLSERDVERRENGQVFETKLALQLGRSLSELRNLAAKSSTSRSRINGHDHEVEEFASKLF